MLATVTADIHPFLKFGLVKAISIVLEFGIGRADHKHMVLLDTQQSGDDEFDGCGQVLEMQHIELAIEVLNNDNCTRKPDFEFWTILRVESINFLPVAFDVDVGGQPLQNVFVVQDLDF